MLPSTLLFLALGASAAPANSEPTDMLVADTTVSASAAPEPFITVPFNTVDSGAPAELATRQDTSASAKSCGPWHKWYGEGRWTYVESQFCFETKEANNTMLSVRLQNAWYWWGGAWYDNSQWGFGGGYEASWKCYTTIQTESGVKERISFNSTYNWGGLSGVVNLPLRLVDKTGITIDFYQTGPYWNDAGKAMKQSARFTVDLTPPHTTTT